MPLPALASTELYIVYMGEKKHDDPSLVIASHHDVLTSLLGSKDEALKSIVYSYKHGFSGFAAMLTESQAEELSNFPEVLHVKLDSHYESQTTRSWDFLGLNNDQQPSGLLQRARHGEDIIVGVVDSGIWPESRSFDDRGYGPVPARWKGTCETGAEFNASSCNRKIIGVRWYTGGVEADALQGEFMSARDMGGHGTHVASTIAGSPVRNASSGGLAAGVARGGAPRARLAIYKACWGARTRCGGAAILAAIDDATNDGVDVLSLSLGGFEEFAGTLHAVARGIPVVFSGMNDGPAPQTVRNTVPWVITVAATMMDRSFPTVMQLGNNERLVGQSHYSDDAAVNTSEFRMLVHSRRCNNVTQLASANASGNVVLCYEPSDTPFNHPGQKLGSAIDNVKNLGAKGLIFAGYSSNVLDRTDSCNGIMPCVLVDYEIANRIAFYIASTRSPVVRISPAKSVVGDTVLSPRVASFSARGPSAEYPGILKPDIAAPGVSILAAVRNSYQFMSGTSMACPHVSAIIALLKSIHPDWSPAMIKSAIITTASITDGFGMPIQAEGVPRKLADPFDIGGGHIDPDRAADPGLVYDIDPSDYTKFFTCTLRPRDDCQSFMGKLYQLNLPSISIPDLKNSVTVSRTVTNVGPAEATYRVTVEAPAGVDVSVEPEELTFTMHNSKNATFKVTFTARQMLQGVYTFGSLAWSDYGEEHLVRIPIAVRTVTEEFVADVS
ncbi:hypothetical protein QOZ80_2BG0162590 [Eleusine coracana subsp. coracana]|nr:hypothetical protein QOZ80_2BG0162590 [Eleusine coracana subsp. coracana]